MERIDWELFRSLKPTPKDIFRDIDDGVRDMVSRSYNAAVSKMLSFPSGGEPENNLLENAAAAAKQIEQLYGVAYVSKIAEAILGWYGSARMLPNVFHHFARAAAVAEKLPPAQARIFLDAYSPICFDEGFMETLAADFELFSARYAGSLSSLVNFFISISSSFNNGSNKPYRHYRKNRHPSFIIETYSTRTSEPPDLESYLLATTSSEAQDLWKSTINHVASKIVSGGDYAPMLSLLGSMPPRAAAKLAPRLSDEQLVYAMADVFKEEIEHAEKETVWRQLSTILEKMPFEHIARVNSAASEQKFVSLDEHLEFFYCRYLLLQHNSERYLPQVNKDITALETLLQEEFGEQFHFRPPDFSGTNIERLGQMLSFFKDAKVPDVDAAFRQAEQYGSLRASFQYVPEAIKTIELLRMHGYDTDFYVASGAEIAKSTHELGELIDWKTNFEALTRRVFGTRARRMPDLSIPGYQPGRLYMEMRADYNEAVKGNRHAAINLVSRLLEIVSNIPDNLKSRPIVEFHDELSGLHSQIESNSIVQGGSLTARIWARDVPDSLYHNEELACCIFLPKGAHKEESAKFVLDPQTTMIEYFANGQKPRRSVATLYAGKNDCILMDTWEANQSVYSSLGNVKTKKFVLDTLALAALRALPHAERPLLAVHNCSYGRSREFATFLHSSVGREDSIWHEPTFAFEAVSVDGLAIPKLPSQGHHYTDAFGVNNPLVGKIDAYLMDARKYVAQHHLAKG